MKRASVLVLVVLAALAVLMLGQTAKTALPMKWTVRNLAEQPGPTGGGNLVTFPVSELVAVRPGGAAYAGKTYLIRRFPANGTLIVNGDWTAWRARWMQDDPSNHRDFSNQ